MGNCECEEHEGGQGGGQERQEEVQGWEHRGNKVALLGYNFLFINDIDNHFFKNFGSGLLRWSCNLQSSQISFVW